MNKRNNSLPFYPVFSWGFISNYKVHMRPYLLFVSGVAGYAGMAISFETENFNVLKLGACILSYFLGYGFGQALTDCFQIDTDSISSPYRPLVKGIIKKENVLTVSILGLILISIPLVIFNPINVFILLLSAFGLFTYTYFKKNKTFLGPFWNSWIVMLLPVSGYLCSNNSLSIIDAFNDPFLPLLMIMTFSSYANFVLIGYLKDITADRETGYKTFPVVYGWTKSVWLGGLNALISIISCSYIVYLNFNWFGFLCCIAASIVILSGLIYGLRTSDKTEKNSAIPVASTVRSFLLFHIAVTLCFKSSFYLLIAACLFYIAFEWIIFKRPQKEQI